jgi:hypothetical protein
VGDGAWWWKWCVRGLGAQSQTAPWALFSVRGAHWCIARLRGGPWMAENDVVGDECSGVACRSPSFAVASVTIAD